MWRLLLLSFVIVLLPGCGGGMNGVIRDSGQPVTFAYEQSAAHDSLQTTLPDGETFSGKVVMVGHSTGIMTGFGTGSVNASTGVSARRTGAAFGVVSTYTGNMHGILFGNKGHTMRCNLNYADSSGFTSMGGVGVCETSDGRVIDVLW